jgi:tetratricopeptide (TPR) repeat protein
MSDPQTEALFAQGLALHRQGQWVMARTQYERVLALRPEHVQALGMLGVLALQMGRFADAAGWLERASAADPGDAAFHSNRGLALHELGQIDAALTSYDQALALAPSYAECHFNRANTLRSLGRTDEALAGYARAVALTPAFVQAHANRATLLQDLGRLDEALQSADAAIALAPDVADLHSNRANLLQDLGRLDEAIDGFERAIALDPAHDAQWNRAFALLLAGRLEEGWRAHEWRARNPKVSGTLRRFAQPLWLGQTPLEGKRILLHAEQGLGDTIQFCRYARLVAERGAHVILTVPRPLVGLLRGLHGVAALHADGDPLPYFDVHCPLMSLPLAFGTTLDTAPNPQGYLKPDPALVARWAARLEPRTAPRVGLVWSGNPEQGNDRRRSMPLSLLADSLPPGLDYFSLQKDVRPTDRPVLDADDRIVDLGREISDFADTAALCAHMDVVVSVCTSVAHLSGALGRPTWVLLSSAADWRWFLEREDSPWYASARLFRQGVDGTWEPVLARLADELAKLT